MGSFLSDYSELVFTKRLMKERLSKVVFERYLYFLDTKQPLSEDISYEIANAMRQWATDQGASHFTHWFQPQRQGTAEKHDAFIDYDADRNLIESFSMSQLVQSEPDASSFPSGGIRSTFEARGYTVWDPSSPVFLRDFGNTRILVIPSIYVSWTGFPLDMKVPLLRSIRVLNDKILDFQKLIGNEKVTDIQVFLGLEQEYFLIPKSLFEEREDLAICDRTVLGRFASKGQIMADHYFGVVSEKVAAFMSDIDKELYRYGIPIKTKHNEVAPNQFELAPLYEEANLAIDHNLQCMDIATRIADKHDLVVLFHEKPFEGINGSGKHMNWSVVDNLGVNYLNPAVSKTTFESLSFLSMLAAFFLGVLKYGDLLHVTVLDAANELRLGANEAPPSIISIYLGEYLTKFLDNLEGSKETIRSMPSIEHGLENIPLVVKDNSDRNRTSPLAFTGNKFEFRALGSSCNPSGAAMMMNSIVAYGYQLINDRLQEFKNEDGIVDREHCVKVICDVFKETKDIRYEGNNYSEEWIAESKSRGLPAPKNTPEALEYLLSEKNIAFFETLGILSEADVKSRYEISIEAYVSTRKIEMRVLLDMCRQKVNPAILNQIDVCGRAYLALEKASLSSPQLIQQLGLLKDLYDKLVASTDKLEHLINSLTGLPCDSDRAKVIVDSQDFLDDLRLTSDKAECVISSDIWRIPSYDRLLSRI